jgi:hypothetical protein
MSFLCRAVVAFSLSVLLCGPLAADVIPSGYSAKNPAKESVQARLVELGVDAATARDRVQRLSADEAAYLAADPNRVQIVGQEIWAGQSNNFWWEWLFGAAAVVGAVVLIWVTYDNW